MHAVPLTIVQSRRLQTAFAQLASGDVASAISAALQLVDEAPNAPDAHQLLAMCHADAGNPGDADSAFRRALDLAPDSAVLLINYAAMLRKYGRTDVAFQVLKHAVQLAPKHAGAWTDLGLAGRDLGYLAEASRALTRASELDPGSALIWHALGDVRRAQNDIESAASAYERATTLAPNYASAWANLGAVTRLLGRPAAAIECLHKAQQCGYSSPELDNVIAGALRDDGRVEEALEHARSLVDAHPDFAPGYLTLAHLLWETGAETEDACSMMREAVRARPGNRELRLEYARLLIAAGKPDTAVEELRVLRAADDHPRLALLEANALDEIGESAHADVLYRRLSPLLRTTDTTFLNAYARHLLRTGEWRAARDIAWEATRLDRHNQEAWAYLSTAWRLLQDPREDWLCNYDSLVTLVEVDPPPGYGSISEFLDTLTATLTPLHKARREPVQQSLRKGSQTSGRLFGRPDPVLDATHNALVDAIERWIRTLPRDAEHPCLSRFGESVRFVGSWSVRLNSSGNHVNHFHPDGWLSSAFYVALPPSVSQPTYEADDLAGCIQFGQPPVELGLNLAPRRVVRPRRGFLALFPSYLWHGTVPFVDSHPRMTIAFDMVPSRRHSRNPGA